MDRRAFRFHRLGFGTRNSPRLPPKSVRWVLTPDILDASLHPDAIFCANDLMAVGCYEALKERGIRAGADIAVMGYDDKEIAQHLSPALSTVLLPHREMGQWCAEQLLKADRPVTQERHECPLVIRDSHIGMKPAR